MSDTQQQGASTGAAGKRQLWPTEDKRSKVLTGQREGECLLFCRCTIGLTTGTLSAHRRLIQSQGGEEVTCYMTVTKAPGQEPRHCRNSKYFIIGLSCTVGPPQTKNHVLARLHAVVKHAKLIFDDWMHDSEQRFPPSFQPPLANVAEKPTAVKECGEVPRKDGEHVF